MHVQIDLEVPLAKSMELPSIVGAFKDGASRMVPDTINYLSILDRLKRVPDTVNHLSIVDN